ncbi:glycosyltransferase [Rhizobium sp. Root708]|uniref:glycosyltransferase n=1 Tax=Rhizobium sp. Root708 TaxID=1736592 RepID=UPI000A75F6EF|nr:glycosyltransferase [Rhizobium sp. Root708]
MMTSIAKFDLHDSSPVASLEQGKSSLEIRNGDGELSDVGIVAIGRNEGQRLVDCLVSLKSRVPRIVYVDSGSKDGSVERARDLGAIAVALDDSLPFTAARGRNRGLETLIEQWPDLKFVQFIDGDCQLQEGWLERARSFLVANSTAVAAYGNRREKFPERTLYNALVDRDWKGRPGEIYGCGGDVMMRISALRDVGGYRDWLIAGEESEMCVRLREKGWRIWRLDGEMSRHDVDMHSFKQWWRRSVRGGHAFAQVSYLHRKSACAIWKKDVARIVFWACCLPLTALATMDPSLLILYPLQIIRQAWREGLFRRESWRNALFDSLIKFAEMQGVFKFYANLLAGRLQTIIEYK